MNENTIISLIDTYKKRNKKFTSFEISPKANLKIEEFEINAEYPSFFSIVWKLPPHVDLFRTNSENVIEIPAIKLAQELSHKGKTVLMHLTCANMSKDVLKCILDQLKKYSIKNILLLRGDNFIYRDDENYFNHVCDMIAYVRELYGDYFCIGIAGFPTIHPESPDLKSDMKYLKYKVVAGANFIITQVFYESKDFIDYVNRCRDADIMIPIIPGFCWFSSYATLKMTLDFTSVNLPRALLTKISNISDNEMAVVNVVNNFVMEAYKHLNGIESICPGIHWFTFNNPAPVINLIKNTVCL